MFMVALFIIGENQNNVKNPSREDGKTNHGIFTEQSAIQKEETTASYYNVGT